MDIKKRNFKIYEMNKQGSTYREIAEHFNLSRERIRCIVQDMKSKENDKNTPPLKKLLPVRVQNILKNVFDDENIFEKPEIIAEKGESDFIKWKNFGRIGIKQLTTALESLGYNIDCNFSNNYYINPIVKTSKTILRNYFNYYSEHSLDDTEYIPIVRVIIESIVQSVGRIETKYMEKEKIGEYLKDFNRKMYEDIWLQHAKEEEGSKVDEQEELKEARKQFNYIYEHEDHP